MSGMHRDRVEKDEKVKKQERNRHLFQLAAAVLLNGYARGFMSGKLYTGKGKYLCVPVLNCYSCPGALGACPIGAMQAVAGGSRHNLSFYIVGTLMLIGTVFGRLACGFLCPFGFLQDLLHKLPVPKLRLPQKADRFLRWIKYVLLAFFVLLLPALVVNPFGQGTPWFCKYLCPAGTLEGGVFHMIANPQLRQMAGVLFTWKVAVLALVLAGAVFIERFFCKYLCPLGAFYGLFNRFAFFRMQIDKHGCIDCGKCESVCPMNVKVREDINSAECIRCGRCRAACPAGAVRSSFQNNRAF